MKRRVLLLALVAILALVSVAGCSETEEEMVGGTIRDFYSAYNARDWEACLGHLDDADNAGAGVIRAALEAARGLTGEVAVESVTDIKVTGSTATAQVKVAYGGGAESEDLSLVKKGDGHWKIAWREAPGGNPSSGTAEG